MSSTKKSVHDTVKQINFAGSLISQILQKVQICTINAVKLLILLWRY